MPPSSIRADRRASSDFIPWRIISSANISAYPRTSASRSRSLRRLPRMFRKKLVTREMMGMLRPPYCACFASFVPQGDHGIYAHGAAGWDVASCECDGGEDDNHCSERDGVRPADAVD